MSKFLLENHSHYHGDTWTADGAGNPISEAAGSLAANLSTLDEHHWQSTDGAAINTRLHRTLDRPRPVGAPQLRGISADTRLARITMDRYWVERWGIRCDGGTSEITSGLTIATSADTTFCCWCRPIQTTAPGSAASQALAALWAGATNNDFNRDWTLELVTATGQITARFARYSGSSVTINSLASVTDADFHHLALCIIGTTGNFYIDGVLQGSTTVAAHSSQANEELTLNRIGSGAGSHYFGDAQIYNRGLSAVEIAALYTGDHPHSNANGLELWWKFQAGTGVNISDESQNAHTGTLTGGGTWMQWVRPSGSADFSSGLIDVRGPWLARSQLGFDGVGDGARTGTNLANAISMSVAMTIEVPNDPGNGAATEIFSQFGTASTALLSEFWFRINSAGALSVVVMRYSGNSVALDFDSAITAGVPHRLILIIDGQADTASVYVDGVLAAGPTAIDPYSAQTSQRFSLGSSVTLASNSRLKISGDAALWNRAIDPSEDRPHSWLASELENDLEDNGGTFYLHYDLEDNAATLDNRGSAGTGGDMTLTGGTWGTLDASHLPTNSTKRHPGAPADIPRDFTVPAPANVKIKHCLWEFASPNLAALEAHYAGLWQYASTPSTGTLARDRAHGAAPVYSHPSISRSPGGQMIMGSRLSFRGVQVTWSGLSLAVKTELQHFLGRLVKRPAGIMLETSQAGDNDPAYRAESTIIGTWTRISITELQTMPTTLYIFNGTLEEEALPDP